MVWWVRGWVFWGGVGIPRWVKEVFGVGYVGIG